MSLFAVALLDIVIIWFFFGNSLLDWLLPSALARKREQKLHQKALRQQLRREEDILSEEERMKLQTGHALPQKAWRHCCNWTELLVVSVAVAFGIRSLYIQPFKIPTGSMQPTLCGIHYVKEPLADRGKLGALCRYLNFGRRQAKMVIGEAGTLLPQKITSAGNSFLPSTVMQIGSQSYCLPGEPSRLLRQLWEDALAADDEKKAALLQGVMTAAYYQILPRITLPAPLNYTKGEVVMDGALEEGDHLFVNRLSLAFREPLRGEIMVFLTDHLTSPNGQSFGGRYYVKRLVGMPGDTLKIQNRQIYVKEKGKGEFRPLTGKDHPAFEKIYSMKNGYRGHAAMAGAAHLFPEGTEFQVPENHYFMLGDNTDNSLDSRYWGTVPRENLVGSPCFVWWPFSRRFGGI